MPRMLPVLLGGDANVYGMARSFYECYGVRSLAVCRRALPALAHSRLVRVAVQDPAFGQDHVFTATLLGLAAQYPGVPKILISCADDYTALLARHADALRGAYRFACPPPAALHLADKRQFAAACRAAGLRTPQTVTLCPADALPPLPFGWPVIAKPADQAAYARCDFPGRRKVYLVQDAARLRELLAAAARGGYFGSWLVQEYIPGPDTRLGVVNAYCAADGSVPWLVQGQPLLQERTPEGTGNYAAVLVEPSRQDAALLDALRGLLQAAGWHGFANFDLKYDRRGEPVLFELNPRQGRGRTAGRAAGAGPAVRRAGHAADAAPRRLVHRAVVRRAPRLPEQACPAPCRHPAAAWPWPRPSAGSRGGGIPADMVYGSAIKLLPQAVGGGVLDAPQLPQTSREG